MRFFALATDYDGTLAYAGRVSDEVIAALKRLRDSGRKLLLVTGRILPDLLSVFPQIELFDLVVAENGALLYHPKEKQEQILAAAPPDRFVAELQERGISPLEVGRVIVASWESQAPAILETIRSVGLESHLIFNKGSVMVLPSGVNKATGLAAALNQCGLSPHNVIGIGDAENDHAFITFCNCGVVVSGALPALKERADFVTRGDHGAGVIELIDGLIENDFAIAGPSLARHDILLGHADDGSEIRFPAYGGNLLIAGSSGGGKSSLTTGVVERMLNANYQVCIVDPEGDYDQIGNTVVLGDAKSGPTPEEAAKALEKPEHNVVVNLVGIAFEERAGFFQSLISRLQDLRSRSGRPHFIIVDEAHHVLPSTRGASQLVIPQGFTNTVMITVRPEHTNTAAVAMTNLLVAVGKEPGTTARSWSEAVGRVLDGAGVGDLERGEAFLWRKDHDEPPVRFRVAPGETERVRHSRKYATGELSPDASFYFRGPENKLKLRAQNLVTFVQMADGVDDDTWLHHLRHGDYSRWFREGIRSDDLAAEAEAVEAEEALSAEDSRKRIREAIERRFTLPA